MLYSSKVKSSLKKNPKCDQTTGFPHHRQMHTLLKLCEHNKKKLMFHTKGNGSSSSLVKELKGYDEEAIRSTQY